MRSIISIAAILAVAIAGAVNADPVQWGADLDVVELASRLGIYSYILALGETNLTDTVRNTDPITVFIPSNQAFRNLPQSTRDYWAANPEYYKTLMAYHVVKGSFPKTMLVDEYDYPTLAGNLTGRFNLYNHSSKPDVLTYMGAVITDTDFKASNGYIHFIDRVVLHVQNETKLQLVQQSADLTTFLNASLTLKDFANTTLGGTNVHTLFAPNNDAFLKLPKGSWDKLLQNQTALADVLNYHVTKLGTYYSAGLMDNEMVPTLTAASSVTITLQNNQIYVNSKARIVEADNAATNGAIHVIDTVLFPPAEQYRLKA